MEGGNDSTGGQNAADPLGQDRAIAYVTADLLREEIDASRCEGCHLLVLATCKSGGGDDVANRQATPAPTREG